MNAIDSRIASIEINVQFLESQQKKIIERGGGGAFAYGDNAGANNHIPLNLQSSSLSLSPKRAGEAKARNSKNIEIIIGND
jgi:hypothetical protein